MEDIASEGYVLRERSLLLAIRRLRMYNLTTLCVGEGFWLMLIVVGLKLVSATLLPEVLDKDRERSRCRKLSA